jgi:hypothetical protein
MPCVCDDGEHAPPRCRQTRGKSYSTFQSREQHMRRIQAVNKIGRESRCLLLRVDYKIIELSRHLNQPDIKSSNWCLLTFSGCIWVRNVHRLHAGLDLLSFNFAVRLDDG